MQIIFKTIINNAFKGLVFLSLGIILLYFVYVQINNGYQEQCALDNIPSEDCNLIEKLISDFKSANLYWLLVVWLGYMLSNISRALRWKQLITPMGYTVKILNAFGTIMIGYFANLGLPRLGELVRPALLSKYENIPLEKVLGTVVVDRIMDFVMLAIFILLALVVSFDDLTNMLIKLGVKSGIQKKSVLLVYFIIGSLALLATLYFFRNSSLLTKIYTKVKNVLSGFKDGLLSIRQLKSPRLFLFHSFFIWTMYWLMSYYGFKAFGPTSALGLETALIIFILGGFGMIVPTPGGMGSYHYLIATGLTFYSVSVFDGFAYAMIMFFLVHLFGNILFGLLFLLVLPFYNKNHN